MPVSRLYSSVEADMNYVRFSCKPQLTISLAAGVCCDLLLEVAEIDGEGTLV